MIVVFVHGMGRSPASGWLLLHRLRQAGFRTASFGYLVSLESFDAVVARLAAKLRRLLAEGDLVLVGHSLGGVLLRRALSLLGESEHSVRHLFLLGSPVVPSRLAVRLGRNWLFRVATGDCGRLLGSPARMASVPPPRVPTTGIAGTRGLSSGGGPFGSEPNDGVVSLFEVSAPWLQDQVLVAVVHTLLPSSAKVASVILARLLRHET